MDSIGGPRIGLDLYVDDHGRSEPLHLHAHERLDCYIRGSGWEIELHLDDDGPSVDYHDCVGVGPEEPCALHIYVDDKDGMSDATTIHFRRSAHLYGSWRLATGPGREDLHVDARGQHWLGSGVAEIAGNGHAWR